MFLIATTTTFCFVFPRIFFDFIQNIFHMKFSPILIILEEEITFHYFYMLFTDMRSNTLPHVRYILFSINKSKKKNPSIFLWWFASVILDVSCIRSLLAGSTFFFISWNFDINVSLFDILNQFAFNFLVFSFCWDTYFFVNLRKFFIFIVLKDPF